VDAELEDWNSLILNSQKKLLASYFDLKKSDSG